MYLTNDWVISGGDFVEDAVHPQQLPLIPRVDTIHIFVIVLHWTTAYATTNKVIHSKT